MKEKHVFLGYIVLGILYLVVKIVYVSAGYLHTGAVAHGAIPAVLTAFVGIIAIRKNIDNSKKLFWLWLMIFLPMLLLFITPLFMYLKQGAMWLANGRPSVLIIYECLAITQLVIAVSIKRILYWNK